MLQLANLQSSDYWILCILTWILTNLNGLDMLRNAFAFATAWILKIDRLYIIHYKFVEICYLFVHMLLFLENSDSFLMDFTAI